MTAVWQMHTRLQLRLRRHGVVQHRLGVGQVASDARPRNHRVLPRAESGIALGANAVHEVQNEQHVQQLEVRVSGLVAKEVCDEESATTCARNQNGGFVATALTRAAAARLVVEHLQRREPFREAGLRVLLALVLRLARRVALRPDIGGVQRELFLLRLSEGRISEIAVGGAGGAYASPVLDETIAPAEQ